MERDEKEFRHNLGLFPWTTAHEFPDRKGIQMLSQVDENGLPPGFIIVKFQNTKDEE